jgi:hypothetical protein
MMTLTASAQTQIVNATPGYINLGTTTSVVVTAPTSGAYSVVVQKPSGAAFTASLTFATAGQSQNVTFGNATSGFKALVDQVGTYNVFVENSSSRVVSSTSFYATDKLLITMEMVTGGTCDYVSGVTRGAKLFPHTYITYASNGAPWTNAAKGFSVEILSPTGWTTATWDPYSKAFEIGVLPNWNYTSVGPWNPVINASDAAGNVGYFKYTGSPFVITPAELDTVLNITDATTGQLVAGLYNGQKIDINATITYPTNAEPVNGFVAPLNSTRGGSVTVQVGWGFYNKTSGTFGGKNLGGLLGTVPMTYAVNGSWTGQFVSNSLPALKPGTYYEVVVSAKDGASPANTGFALSSLPPATVAPAITQTQTTPVSSVSTVISTIISSTTQSVVQTVQTIPTVVYAALAILLIVGLIIGLIVRVPRR